MSSKGGSRRPVASAPHADAPFLVSASVTALEHPACAASMSPQPASPVSPSMGSSRHETACRLARRSACGRTAAAARLTGTHGSTKRRCLAVPRSWAATRCRLLKHRVLNFPLFWCWCSPAFVRHSNHGAADRPPCSDAAWCKIREGAELPPVRTCQKKASGMLFLPTPTLHNKRPCPSRNCQAFSTSTFSVITCKLFKIY